MAALELVYYTDRAGREPFKDWLLSRIVQVQGVSHATEYIEHGDVQQPAKVNRRGPSSRRRVYLNDWKGQQ
jgi:hypothetical protein